MDKEKKYESEDSPCVSGDTIEVHCGDCLKIKHSERLTQWTPTGASLKLGEPKSLAETAAILKEQFKKACNKLALFEDLIESGQLVDISPYIVKIRNEIPFKYKVIKPTVHRRNVEMCDSWESAARLVMKLTEGKKT